MIEEGTAVSHFAAPERAPPTTNVGKAFLSATKRRSRTARVQDKPLVNEHLESEKHPKFG